MIHSRYVTHVTWYINGISKGISKDLKIKNVLKVCYRCIENIFMVFSCFVKWYTKGM